MMLTRDNERDTKMILKKKIGIREENKYTMERRVAITPQQAQSLIESYPIEIEVLESTKRVFTDAEYKKAGCSIVGNLDGAPVIFGVKEIPLADLQQGKTYVFFSHVIKGQPYNMPMLEAMMNLQCTLIDYERIVDEKDRRLIFFGRYAGISGMINTLWALGIRLQNKGIANPFAKLCQAYTYPSLEAAEKILAEIGDEIRYTGLPAEISPVTIGITGYGNVSTGVQDILDLLPVTEITPAELKTLRNNTRLSNKTLYKVVFKEEHISKRNDGAAFLLSDFFTQPEHFHSIFDSYTEHLTMWVNCMYWDARYDRLLTKKQLATHHQAGREKLLVIGDISCDPQGGIEISEARSIEEPVFVYNPRTNESSSGFDGEGILVMAVDILPSELPRESSIAFSEMLADFIAPIADCNYNQPFETIALPYPIKRAMILLQGQLTPEYRYLESYLNKPAR
jgi:alpha-aminoadipic semialdehyde synthase